MAVCPFAVQRPVAAHGGAIGSIFGTVIHVTAGEGDPYNEFANPNNQVSSHFGIGNGQGGMADGLIEQYVDTSLASWAQSAGNGNYLSVETEGVPTEALTQAQIDSFGHLMAWMYKTHSVALVLTDTVGGRGLITHGDGGAAWGGHTGCPGPIRAGQRQAILNVALAELFPPATPSQKDSDMIATTNTGLGYWVCKPDGSVYSFGDAVYHGGLNPGNPTGWTLPPGVTAISISALPDGAGYRILSSIYQVYCFGAAQFFGNP